MYVLTEMADIGLDADEELQDESIVARITTGERLFGVLYERYRTRTFALAFGMTGQREQAEDLTQEIFIRVFEKLNTFQGQAKFATWFYRIALNQCLNHCRNERRRHRALESPDESKSTVLGELRVVEPADATLLRK
jgi:RNA polymerase sigma factor (sigma-70 family)